MSFITGSTSAFANKGKLLEESDYRELAESRSLNEVVSKLRGRDYDKVLTELEPPYSLKEFEFALRRRLIDLHMSLQEKTEQSPLVQAYYGKHLTWNLKVILKGLSRNRAYDDIVKDVDLYAEEKVGRRDLVVRALESHDLEEAREQLSGFEFGEEVALAVELFWETGELQVFDTVLDRAYLSEVVRALSRLDGQTESRTEAFVGLDVDSYHALATLRSKTWDVEPSRIRDTWIDSYFEIPESNLTRMAGAEEFVDAARELEKTPYRRVLPEEFVANPAELISAIEDGFHRYDVKESRRAFLQDIFGLSVVLAMIRLKEYEVRALLGVGVGVDRGTAKEKIMQKILMPVRA